MIPRILTQTVVNRVKSGFINIIYGPRRVGKTILLKQIADKIKLPGVWFDGDHQETRNALSNTSLVVLSKLVNHSDAVFIDEAQRIPNIGLALKILIGAFPNKKIFVTGSSSLRLSQGIQDSLTGRNLTYRLFPLSTKELAGDLQDFQKSSLLQEQLRFGGYPYLQTVNNQTEKREYLKSMTEDYLFKDVVMLKDISQPDNLRKLATLLAFQIGSEVSYNELASNLNIDVKTVIRYLDLLKLSFVIFEIGSFSKNLRKEIAKSKKYYFWDLGIRNALIDQFHELTVRRDTGSLWENFLAVDRLKKHEYSGKSVRYYFWRTYDQAEIDWIEVEEGNLTAFEFKFKKANNKTPKKFLETYKKESKTITKENYLTFL